MARVLFLAFPYVKVMYQNVMEFAVRRNVCGVFYAINEVCQVKPIYKLLIYNIMKLYENRH